MQDSEEQDQPKLEEQLTVLNSELQQWSMIWNGLRADPNFPISSKFLWQRVLEPIYHKIPPGAQLALEVDKETYQGLSPKLRDFAIIDVGREGPIRYFLYFDPPSGKATNLKNVSHTLFAGDKGDNLIRFGVSQVSREGATATGEGLFTQSNILGIRVAPEYKSGWPNQVPPIQTFK